MTRYCEGCQQPRPLRDFDLEEEPPERAMCRSCAHARTSSTAQRSRAERHEQLVGLERQRRALIAALVKIDAEIAELRGRPVSAAFERVEPTDVFDDTDLGFGD